MRGVSDGGRTGGVGELFRPAPARTRNADASVIESRDTVSTARNIRRRLGREGASGGASDCRNRKRMTGSSIRPANHSTHGLEPAWLATWLSINYSQHRRIHGETLVTGRLREHRSPANTSAAIQLVGSSQIRLNFFLRKEPRPSHHLTGRFVCAKETMDEQRGPGVHPATWTRRRY
jgi:hypothetical protein